MFQCQEAISITTAWNSKFLFQGRRQGVWLWVAKCIDAAPALKSGLAREGGGGGGHISWQKKKM